MKAITTEEDFKPISNGIEAIFRKGKRIPDNIFNSRFKSFIVTNYTFMEKGLLEDLKQFLELINEDYFYVCSIYPEPLSIASDFNFYGAFKVPCRIEFEKYCDMIEKYPLENFNGSCNADSLRDHSMEYLFFSDSYKWAIYLEYWGDYGICAFSDDSYIDKLKLCFGDRSIEDIEEGAESVYWYYCLYLSKKESSDLIKQFINNYS